LPAKKLLEGWEAEKSLNEKGSVSIKTRRRTGGRTGGTHVVQQKLPFRGGGGSSGNSNQRKKYGDGRKGGGGLEKGKMNRLIPGEKHGKESVKWQK